MATVVCECGATYSPQDIYARNRHEASAKHMANLPKPEPEPFDDLDLDEPVVEKPKSKAKPKVPKTVNVGNRKMCRVCGVDKLMEDYRKKSSRPDGRDTICAACSKDWLIAHRARKAAPK
jgi:hypothetical protein